MWCWLFELQGTTSKSPFDHSLGCESEAAIISCVYFFCLIYGHRLPDSQLEYLSVNRSPCQPHQKHTLSRYYFTTIICRCMRFWWSCRLRSRVLPTVLKTSLLSFPYRVVPFFIRPYLMTISAENLHLTQFRF